jgi:4-hydroxy-tetrahydrodipicolinate synthase
LGSTGTYAYLTRAERRRAIEAAVGTVGGKAPILVGVGALRTDEAIALARDAKAIGASAGLLAAVSYTPLTEDEVFAHYAAVARESELPIRIYDNPGTTHFSFTPALLARLGRVPGIVALKTSAPGADAVAAHLAKLRETMPPGFAIGYSADWNAAEGLLAGADAWYSVLGGILPGPCLRIVRAAKAGDTVEARRLNAMLEPVWALFREFTSLRTVYAMANLLGLTDADPPRPILPLGNDARRRIAEAIGTLDF